MEIIAIIVFGGILLWLLIKWIAFSSFKAQLMNAFGAKGFDYKTADTIYALHSRLINSMHREGLSAEAIVDGLTLAADISPITPTTRANRSPRPTECASGNADDERTQLQDFEVDNSKLASAVEFVLGSLTAQATLLEFVVGDLDPNLVDDWAIGYMHGHYDACLQRSNLELDDEALVGFHVILRKLLGDEGGFQVAEKHKDLSLQPSSEFKEGAAVGGQDLYDFLANNERPPTSWAMRFHEGKIGD